VVSQRYLATTSSAAPNCNPTANSSPLKRKTAVPPESVDLGVGAITETLRCYIGPTLIPAIG
jgi:hypothetical protein